MRLVVVVGSTKTATIEGISAAGLTPAMMAHTPAADAEIVVYGQPVFSPVTPVSPTGCPTPAVVTRAVQELIDLDVVVADTGLATTTGAPTVSLGENPGGDIRDRVAVPNASEILETARALGRGLPDDELFIAESIPGGTTTAMAILHTLKRPYAVSSSLPDNPLERKQAVVDTALRASDLRPGDGIDDPVDALQAVGDPVLAGVIGITQGAIETGTNVTLAGGTQMIAAASVLREVGCDESLGLATTSFIAADDAVDLSVPVAELDLSLTVTDPGFNHVEHPAMVPYCHGEAKEGVGMGGALALATRHNVSMEAVRERITICYERLGTDHGS